MILKVALLGLLAMGAPLLAGEAIDRANRAGEVLDEVMMTPESSIPQDLLNKAHCVAIIPGVKKAGFIVGGHAYAFPVTTGVSGRLPHSVQEPS